MRFLAQRDRSLHAAQTSLRSARAGFTLLEVLISVAILSLGLSTIFGSSILAARGTAHARMVTSAAMLAQCRMTEVEAYLKKSQLPETEMTVEDPPESGGERCCEAPFTCIARIEKIELPQPTDVSTAAGDRLLGSAAGAARGQSFGGIAAGTGGGDGGASPLSQLAGAFGGLGAGGADPSAGIAGALAGAGGSGGGLAGAGAPNLQGMAAQLLTGIYPTIKPMFEGAIRKVTVTVRWNEGSREFSFDVLQYVTNPGQTMSSAAPPDLGAIPGLSGILGGAGAPAPAAPATSAPVTR